MDGKGLASQDFAVNTSLDSANGIVFGSVDVYVVIATGTEITI